MKINFLSLYFPHNLFMLTGNIGAMYSDSGLCQLGHAESY